MEPSGMLRRMALIRTTRRNIPEDAILHSHRRENLKSYQVPMLNQLSTTPRSRMRQWMHTVYPCFLDLDTSCR
jgi:hypothetical protein